MDYGTTQCTGGTEYPPPKIPVLKGTLFKTPRFDGLPTSSELLVSALRQDQDKTSISLSQLKEENPANSLFSNCSKVNTFEPREAEYADQSGDTEFNTECKFYPYINILITYSLLVESISSRTLSEESDKAESVKPSRIRGKNYTGKFYCRINILLLIYY